MQENEKENYGLRNLSDIANVPLPTSGVYDKVVDQNIDFGDNNNQKKNKIKFIIIFLIIGVFLSSGAGAFYYYKITDPQVVFLQAVDNMKNLKSFHYKADGRYFFKPKNVSMEDKLNFALADIDESGEVEFGFTADGDISKTEKGVSFLQNFTLDAPGVQAGTRVFVISLARKNKENFWFKISDIPPVPFFDVSALKDKWVKINFDNIASKYNIDLSVVDKKQQQDDKKIAEVMDKIKENVKNNIFLKFTRKGSEEVSGTKTYHYQWEIDKEKAKKFFIELSHINKEDGVEFKGRYNKVVDDISEQDISEKIDDFFSHGSVDGEVWISKKDYFFVKSVINIKTNTDSVDAKGLLNLEMSNINQNITIDFPQDSLDIEEIINQFTSKTSLSRSPVVATVDTDSDGLADQGENFYGTDPKNPDTDGDGYYDGDEVDGGYDPKGPGRL